MHYHFNIFINVYMYPPLVIVFFKSVPAWYCASMISFLVISDTFFIKKASLSEFDACYATEIDLSTK